MVRYEELLSSPDFFAVNNKNLIVSPLLYGGGSLKGKSINHGIRSILHFGEYIVPAKLVHLIPKSIKNGVKKENEKYEKAVAKMDLDK